MTGKYKLADFPVIIDSVHDLIHKQCNDYTYDGMTESEIYIKTSQQDIELEREKLKYCNLVKSNTNDDYIESLAIYRKFCNLITARGSLIMQGCAISAYGNAYLLTPNIDTENISNEKFWLSGFGNCAEIVNNKYPIIKVENNTVFVYSSPWCNCEEYKKNKKAPLKAICIINHDKTNHIEEISIADGYATILRQCSYMVSNNNVSIIISNLNRILKRIHLYSLGCNMEPSSAVIAYEKMKNKTKNIII